MESLVLKRYAISELGGGRINQIGYMYGSGES